MLIELSNEPMYGEPGPNIVWIGEVSEFGRIYKALEILANKDVATIRLKSDDFFEIKGCRELILKSNPHGKKLIHINKDFDITTEIPKDKWISIVNKIKTLSNEAGFFYIEFENDENSFVEDANWIVESTV